MEDVIFGVRRSRSRGREQATKRRIGTRTVDDYETLWPPGKFSLGPQTSLETSPAPRCEAQQRRAARRTTLWLGRRGAKAAKKPTSAFWHPDVVVSNTLLAAVWIAYRGSAVKCARSQVRPFHDDDEAPHEHVTDLGKRLLHEGDFSYEDITGQDEPPVDSPPAPGETTATRPPGPDGEGQMDMDPEARRRMRGKTRLISLEQPTVPPVSASPDTTRQEAEGDNDDKRRRIDEPGSPVSPVAQDEVSTLSPVPFDSEKRNDEIAVDVPLPEEPAEMSGENGQGWITEETFFSWSRLQVPHCKEAKINELSPAEKREFLKSMEVERQTLLKNQAAKVLSLEETAQARARWPDRAMDTRWART